METSRFAEARDAAHMLNMRVDMGWFPALLTFMFNQMPGSQEAIRRGQESEIERAYGRFVTRVVRRPLSSRQVDRLPIWIGAPDFPVYKHERQALRDVSINDGQHVHVMTVTPPKPRFRTDLRTYVEENQQLFTGDGFCCRVHAEPIIDDMARLAPYVTKSIDRHRFGEDALIVFPRSRSELLPSSHPIGRNASIFADGTCAGTETPPACAIRRNR